MTKSEAWAIQTRRGTFVNVPYDQTSAYKIATFKTKNQAKLWLDNDPFWHDKASVVPIVITTRARGEV